MILAVRNPCDGIHEGHRFVVVAEAEGLFDLRVGQRPAIEPGQQLPRRFVGQRGDAAFARGAVTGGQIAACRHVVLLGDIPLDRRASREVPAQPADD